LLHYSFRYGKFRVDKMSGGLIALTGMIYLYVGLEQYFKFNNVPMLYTYIGYAFANVGLYMMASR
tara:strand:+ start:10573 stop:10767 length:195 start_codon:yes stop_codon:yes gene_type:complete